jgi:hypothetical protein
VAFGRDRRSRREFAVHVAFIGAVARSYLINTFKPLKACELCKLA